MKTAICIAGYFDSLTDPSSKGIDGYKHLDKNVFSKSDEVDIFIHSWDINHKQQILDLYGDKVKSHIFEPQINFEPYTTGVDYIDNPRSSQAVLFSQYYSIQKSFELLYSTNKKYDCVIKTRFDVGRINHNTAAIPVQCITFDPTLPMENFYLADWGYFDTEGPADMWFYSNYKNMKHFCDIYDLIKKDMIPGGEMEEWAGSNDGGIHNGIKCYKWFLIQRGLWDKKVPLQTYKD
jgi:hypothetical protein